MTHAYWSNGLTGFDRLEAIRNPARQIDQTIVAQLHTVLTRRINGESVHRIIGKRAFFGIELGVSADTLEPRPDTEALVELAIPFCAGVSRSKVSRT